MLVTFVILHMFPLLLTYHWYQHLKYSHFFLGVGGGGGGGVNFGWSPWGLLLNTWLLYYGPHPICPTMVTQPRAWRSAPYLRLRIQLAPHSPYDGYLLA